MLDLPLTSPLMNAAGTLGFAPHSRLIDLSPLGGFVTNPISRAPRTPAAGTRFIPFHGGAVIHTGHPNPGLRAILKTQAPHWSRAALPVIVHLLAETPDDVYRMVRQLEETEGVAGIELGLPPAAGAAFAREAVQAAIGELPLVVKLGLEDAPRLAAELQGEGVSAFTLGAPRGALPDRAGKLVGGRVLGGAVLALGVEVLRGLVPLGTPIIFGAGVQDKSQMALVLELGAAAVQLDTSIWRTGKIAL